MFRRTPFIVLLLVLQSIGVRAFASDGSSGPVSPTGPLPNTSAIFVAQDPQAQSAETKSYDVYQKQSKTIAIPDLRGAVSMDEEVCRVSVRQGQLELLGVARGDAVIIYWVDSQQVNLLIHVVDAPIAVQKPSLMFGSQFATNGFVRTFTTVNAGSSAGTGVVVQNEFAWSSRLDATRELSVQGIAESANTNYAHGFNFTTLGLSLRGARSEYRVGDFALSISPDPATSGSQFVNPVIALRGGDVLWHRGRSSYEAFAGLGLPSYFMNYGGLARAAGFNYRFRYNNRITLMTHTMFSSATENPYSPQHGPRQNDFTVLPMISVRLSKSLGLNAGVGGSQHGIRVTSEVNYQGSSYSLYGGFTRMPQTFPFQLLRTGALSGQNLGFGGSYRFSTKWSVNAGYQRHFDLNSSATTQNSASNAYNISTQYLINHSHSVNASYITSDQNFGTLGRMNLRRLDTGWSSQFTRVSNTAQFSWSHYDGNSLNSSQHQDLVFSDAARYALRDGMQLTGGFTYTRTNFPVIVRLEQLVGLLSPDLQQLFAANPAAFLNSNLIPDNVRAAMNDLQPNAFQLNAGAEFTRGRLTVSPQTTFAIERNSSNNSHNMQFGYHLTYRINPTLWLDSSLSSQYFAVPAGAVQRTNVLTIGLQKSLTRNPLRWIESRFERVEIRGRVFIDKAGDARFHEGEPALSGITVRLSDGSMAQTNELGEYIFRGLSPREYRVSLPLDQFKTPVRLTGTSERSVELSTVRSADVDFGVVNFARISGVIFNDYLLSDERQPNAPLIGGVRLVLTNSSGVSKSSTSSEDGTFDISELDPGDYTLSIDGESLPAGYSIGDASRKVHLEPVSTSNVELPVQAVHTIAGRIVYRDPKDPKGELHPLAGVMISADRATAKTGEDGSFILRSLPGTQVKIQVLPSIPVPAGVDLPEGALQLPFEPKQVENVTIVINDPAMLKYLITSPDTLTEPVRNR